MVYIGTLADSAAMPDREALKNKVVVFRAQPNSPSLAGPDLGPQGRLALIAGIAFTDIDPLIESYGQYLRTPKLVVKHASAAPDGVTQPRLLFVKTSTIPLLFGKPLDQLRPGDGGPALKGEVSFAPTELTASNVVGIVEGSDPALRGEYVALGAHNDAIGIVPPVDHDSLRAYNTVIRPRGANDPMGEPTPEQWARIKAIIDSARKLRPARLDSIVNGADDDGSGSMGLLEIAESVSKGRPAQALAALRLAHRRRVGPSGQPLVHRPCDRSA